MSTTHTPSGPLAGITVLDLATIFAGPSACRHLGDFGANVIKVEKPGAPDGARHLGETDGDDSFYWRITGRNKRPIELDLKAPAGREVLLDLVRQADVRVENFRPGTLERLGLGPEDVLLEVNPRLVVLRVTGYGQTGPYSDRTGFGTMAEAMSTLAHTTGQTDGPPTLPPVALADEVTGLQGAFAILAAIHHRDATGQGQVIDISLLESLIDVLGPAAAIHHRTGHIDGRYGSRLVFSAPRNVYAASDGYIVLSGSANQVALRIFDAIGRPELRDDERFATCPQRVANVEVLDGIIEAWTSQRTVQECIDVFSAAGAACGRCTTWPNWWPTSMCRSAGRSSRWRAPTARGRCCSCSPRRDSRARPARCGTAACGRARAPTRYWPNSVTTPK